MKNVINDVREIILRKDLNEEEKEKLILEYYTDLSEEEQQKYLFILQDIFDEEKFKLVDIGDLISNSKVEVQKENIINVFKKIINPNLAKSMEDVLLNICDDYVEYKYKENKENYKLEYISWIFENLDDFVKKEKFEEICELILESYENKNNENINEYKVKTIINFFKALDEDGKKEEIEYLSGKIINYNGINLNECGDDVYELFKSLKEELKFEKIGELIKCASNNERFKNSMSTFIIGLWISMDDITKINSFKSVIDQICELDMDKSNKRVLAEDLFNKFDKKILIENIDLVIEQIHETNTEFDKLEMYSKVLELFDEDTEKYDEYINIILQKVSEEKKDGNIDLSSKQAFERVIILKEMSYDGIWKWKSYSEEKKKKIIKCFTQILEENVDILENSVLYNFYDAITHNIINLTEEESKIFEAYNKKIRSLENSERLQEYDKIIENNGQIEKDNIKDFIREIKIYRLKNGRIPKKYYDYIIREAVLENIDKMEYEDIIKYCLIDMENDNLESIGIHNYAIGFGATKENTGGFHSELGEIFISQTSFENYNIFQIINTLHHEGRHAEQVKEMYENRYDFNLYKMLKENIIYENHMMFYSENYFDMEIEFDARVYACMKTYEYLLDIGIPAEIIAQIEDNFIENEIAENFNHNRNIKEFCGKRKPINEIFLESFCYGLSFNNILNKDFNKDCLSRYPILQVEFEYSESGKIIRKSNERIREELNERLQTVQDEEERKKIIEFYEKVMQEPENSKSNEQQEDDYIVFLERNGYQVSDSIRARLQGKSLQSHEEDGRKQPNSANLKTKMTIGQAMAFIKKCYYQHTSEERATVSKEIAKEYRDRQSKKSDQGYTK